MGKIRGRQTLPVYKYMPAPKVNTEEQNHWDLGNTVRETEKNFSTDLQLLMTATINDPLLLKTLVCLERQQQDNTTEEYIIYRKKLSTRYGLVFYGDRIIVLKNLRTTVFNLLHKGHAAINKMSMAARHVWWSKLIKGHPEKLRRMCPVQNVR